MFRSIKGTLFFFVTFLIIFFSAYWADGYNTETKKNSKLSFIDYVKSDSVKQIQILETSLQTLPDILKEFFESEDKIKIGIVNNAGDALEVYNIENGSYPPNLKSIINQVKDQKTREYLNNLIDYTTTNGGGSYELSIKLKNGSYYKLSK